MAIALVMRHPPRKGAALKPFPGRWILRTNWAFAGAKYVFPLFLRPITPQMREKYGISSRFRLFRLVFWGPEALNQHGAC
jgi:hypothetical protein